MLSSFLADASLALDTHGSLEEMLQLVAEQARELIGAECCVATLFEEAQATCAAGRVAHSHRPALDVAVAVARRGGGLRACAARRWVSARCRSGGRRLFAYADAGDGRVPQTWLAASLTALDGTQVGMSSSSTRRTVRSRPRTRRRSSISPRWPPPPWNARGTTASAEFPVHGPAGLEAAGGIAHDLRRIVPAASSGVCAWLMSSNQGREASVSMRPGRTAARCTVGLVPVATLARHCADRGDLPDLGWDVQPPRPSLGLSRSGVHRAHPVGEHDVHVGKRGVVREARAHAGRQVAERPHGSRLVGEARARRGAGPRGHGSGRPRRRGPAVCRTVLKLRAARDGARPAAGLQTLRLWFRPRCRSRRPPRCGGPLRPPSGSPEPAGRPR